MFGHGYFGSGYFGLGYFGPDPDAVAPPTPTGTRRPIIEPLGIGRMVDQLGGLAIWKSRRRPPL